MPEESSSEIDWQSFQNLNFEAFRKRALDPRLNTYEKIGCPTIYRQGKDQAIFEDILSKLSNLRLRGKSVLDIGTGCSELALCLLRHFEKMEHRSFLVDSAEMLHQLPEGLPGVRLPGQFPDSFPEFIDSNRGKLDVVLCYGVICTVFLDMSLFKFFDSAVSLLAPGGELLIGDIPNYSKRNRFFSSEAGVEFHKSFMKTDSAPRIDSIRPEDRKIDDGVVLSLLHRYRSLGFDTYLLPQDPVLPLSNRREDVLIRRP